MSVINQMLRDLDARQATDQERAGLPPRLRTLPPNSLGRPAAWRLLLVAIAVIALAAGVAIGVFFVSPSDRPVAPVPPPPATPAVAPPVTPAPPVANEPARTEGGADLGEMKHSTLLSLAQPPTPTEAPPAAKTEKTPALIEKQPVTPRPTRPTSPPATVAATEAPRPVAAEPTPVIAAEAQIDKRSSGGQARDMAEGEYRKGIQAVKRGEAAAALPQLQRALELDPLHAKARQTLLSVLVGAKQWTDAQRVAQAGLALEPAQTGWATILARLQFEQGDIAAALETLTRHAAHAGGDADYQGLFAYLLQKEQRFAEAAQHFQTALSLRPQEGRWWFGLGIALESAGRGNEARDAYLKAREAGNLPPDMASTIEQKLR